MALEQVIVRLCQARAHVQDLANCEDPGSMLRRIEKRIELIGSLDEVQRARLLEIADRCPVHRTLDVQDRDPQRPRFRLGMTLGHSYERLPKLRPDFATRQLLHVASRELTASCVRVSKIEPA